MIQLIRNTLTNKNGFMIFILWNHLAIAGLLTLLLPNLSFWKVTSLGLVITLLVSPYYFIAKQSKLIRYLVAAGLVYYSIAFDLVTDYTEVKFLIFILLGILAAYLDWKLIVTTCVMFIASYSIGFFAGSFDMFVGVNTLHNFILETIAVILAVGGLTYLCLSGQASLKQVEAARQAAEEKEQRLSLLFEEVSRVTEKLDQASGHVNGAAEMTRQYTDEMMTSFREVSSGMES
ncbi:MAG: chemotaxis protein, partial [Clostridia bacterium]